MPREGLMTIMEKIRMRNRIEPELEREVSDVLLDSLREASALERPADEFAPQRMDYSLERVESFLSQRVTELQQARSALAQEADATRERLADLVRRQAIMLIVETSLSEGLAKLTEQMATSDTVPLDEPEQSATEASMSPEEAAR
jgi:hypothetical protein